MKRVLITGASGGLGQALCSVFSKESVCLGVHVFKQKAEGAALVADLSSDGCDAHFFSADLRNADDVREMFRAFHQKWGRIDLLINSAGLNQNALFHKESSEDWDVLMAVNLSGVFYAMREAASLMEKQGKGHIINIASGAAFAGRAGQSAYAASKRGLIGLSLSAAKEWGKSGIQVNSICPGYLETPMTEALSPAQSKKLILENVLGRASTLEEVTAFVFMLSKMKHVSGQVFHLDSRIA